jgi:hypothetical protein
MKISIARRELIGTRLGGHPARPDISTGGPVIGDPASAAMLRLALTIAGKLRRVLRSSASVGAIEKNNLRSYQTKVHHRFERLRETICSHNLWLVT